MAIRLPLLYAAVRRFCLGAFALLYREAGSLPFVLDERLTPGRPALYEYRPLARAYVEAQAARLRQLEDTVLALDELEREPACALLARGGGVAWRGGREALFRTLLLPLLASLVEACGGLEWDDLAFARGYRELEGLLLGERHVLLAVAPLVGLSCPLPVELGRGLRARAAWPEEAASWWPQARRLLPPRFGDGPERTAVLELRLSFPADDGELPDAPAEAADAVTALRLATAAPVAAGPLLFEELEGRPFALRPLPALAASEPAREPSRLDEFRGRLAHDLLERLPLCDEDARLGEAVDRWELALLAQEPLRSRLLRQSLAALLGGEGGLPEAAARAAALVGESPGERARVLARLRAFAGGEPAGREEETVIRRALVATLLQGGRRALLAQLAGAQRLASPAA